MSTGEIEDLANYLADRGFIGSDVSPDISLGEYGLLWNPKDGTAVVTLPYNDTAEFALYHISEEEVRETLKEVPDGFFDFIGSTREEELKALNTGMVPHLIESIQQYNGHFRLHERFPYTAEEIKEKIK